MKPQVLKMAVEESRGWMAACCKDGAAVVDGMVVRSAARTWTRLNWVVVGASADAGDMMAAMMLPSCSQSRMELKPDMVRSGFTQHQGLCKTAGRSLDRRGTKHGGKSRNK